MKAQAKAVKADAKETAKRADALVKGMSGGSAAPAAKTAKKKPAKRRKKRAAKKK